MLLVEDQSKAIKLYLKYLKFYCNGQNVG